jgi:hypothetical protein
MESMAFITLLDFLASLLCSNLLRTDGMICQDRPYLSVSQPQRFGRPPSQSFSQSASTSYWLSQFTNSEMAGVKV